MSVFINEFHYDNSGSDVGEFIEIAGTAGTDLTGWTLVLYNGSNGSVYNTIPLTGVLADDTTTGFGLYVIDLPSNGLQNGSPDGMALVDDSGTVIEFISYEGSFTAIGGPADGMTSTDIGVSESGGTPIGYSLQRVGTGSDANDFTWQPAMVETKDAVNTNQTLIGTPSPITITESGGSTDVHEDGGFDSIFLNIDTPASDQVTILISTDGQVAAPAEVIIAAGWTGSVEVAISAVDDADDEPDPHTGTVSFQVISGDPDFDGLALPGVSVNISDNDEPVITKIHEIQGEGAQNTMDGQVVTIEAVVVGDFQNGDADDGRNLRGFYLQEEDFDVDGNALTSEGIFVFQGTNWRDVNIGDIVRVTGTVDEFFGETQIDTVTDITIVGSTTTMPTAATIDLGSIGGTTINQNGDIQPDLEAYEGMMVTFTQALTITEMFNLDRFNEIKLFQGDEAGDRPQQFTQFNNPDAAGFAEYQQLVGSLTITYDDGLPFQNVDISNLDGFQNFWTGNAPSMGDSITGLTGVLNYQWAGSGSSGATWRVIATEDGQNTFDDTNPADLVPQDVGGDLKVASLNVLNFFTTLDLPGQTTTVGADPRGADNQAEFDRQIEKLTLTLATMDADVVGLVEIENDVTSAPLATLTAALNAYLGSEVYGYVNTGQVGNDAITNAFIYKLDTVALNGAHQVLDTPEFLDPLGDATTGTEYNRPALAQSFTELDTGESFTAVVNHLKSKGSLTGAPEDEDQSDGAGNNNATREAAALELAAWLATDPTGDGGGNQIILGDLNSYAKEDPIQALIAAGFDDLVQSFVGSDALTYVFDGMTGTLDYAMTNSAWTNLVSGVTTWNVNADEADALDYNLDFGRSDSYFDGDSPLRNSDHDPIIVGVSLVGDIEVTNHVRKGPNEVTEYALMQRALMNTTEGARVKVLDGEGVGDFGAAMVLSDDIRLQADAPVEGMLLLGDDVFDFRLSGSAEIGVIGNDLDNKISGGSGANILEGGGGDDLLRGKEGMDQLAGGAGNDTLVGGADSDVFVIREGSDLEIVKGFTIGEDIIRIVNGAVDSFDDLLAIMTDESGGAEADFGGGDILKLQGRRRGRPVRPGFRVCLGLSQTEGLELSPVAARSPQVTVMLAGSNGRRTISILFHRLSVLNFVWK